VRFAAFDVSQNLCNTALNVSTGVDVNAPPSASWTDGERGREAGCLSSYRPVQLIHRLQNGAVLRGVRGKRAVNREALMRLISAVSVFGAAAGDKLAELDLNPVMAGADAAAAVDWLMITR
jgi:hypothetical protein